MEENELIQTGAEDFNSDAIADADDWSDLEGMTFEDTEEREFSDEFLNDGGDQPAEEEAEENEDDSASESEGADEPTTETETEEKAETEETEETAEQGEQTETEARSWTLKHLDDEVTVDENKIVELAQKGLDYDRVREKYDSANMELKTYREKKADYEDYEAFLSELAENSGQSIHDLIESSRARMLIAAERANGRELSDMDALQRVQQLKREADAKKAEQAAEKEPQAQPVESAQDRQRKMFMAFVNEFPDVDPQTIPNDVFVKAQQSGNLISEYRNYIKSQQDDEIKKLKAENEKLKQENKNRARSTGSMKSSGQNKYKNKLDELWYDGT